jgi:hypothetical protein
MVATRNLLSAEIEIEGIQRSQEYRQRSIALLGVEEVASETSKAGTGELISRLSFVRKARLE